MVIESMFDYKEQQDIQDRINALHERDNEKPYFRELADRYRLSWRVANQMKLIERKTIPAQEITTCKDLARLFGVNRSSVIRYLQELLSPKDYKSREILCRVNGGRKGGKKSTNKGYKFTRQYQRGPKTS